MKPRASKFSKVGFLGWSVLPALLIFVIPGFSFWFFRYDSGQPIAYSAWLARSSVKPRTGSPTTCGARFRPTWPRSTRPTAS